MEKKCHLLCICFSLCNTVYLTDALAMAKVIVMKSELYFCRCFYFCSPLLIVVECSDICSLPNQQCPDLLAPFAQRPCPRFMLSTVMPFTFVSFLRKAGREQKCPCGSLVLLNYTIIPDIKG
ncbi:hypothetical protein I79_024313 [Cricetulus griseus]|uniref:Secreted protein n=1 Tax=Cricetulus griseus TaxID=10029 RepID=G3IKB4_CRIGR|nr:hypothetical protein I79_024313 [Cricetulus griseus]